MWFSPFRPGKKGASYLASRLLVTLLAGLVLACSSPEEKANRFYERGMELLDKGDLAKARLEFQNALQINGAMTSAWYGMALVSERQGDWQKLFSQLGKVVDLDPKHLGAHLKLGRLLLAAGQLDQALKMSDATRALDRDNAEVLALRAAVLYKLEDLAGAVAHANAALAKDANNIDALVVLATERLAVGDAKKAIEYLDRGLKRNEKDIALQLIKVQALERLAQLDSAEAIFRKLIAFYPDLRPLRHILAQFYLNNNRRELAEAEYRAIVSQHPGDVGARLDVVRFTKMLHGDQVAERELTAYIAQDPENNELKFALAGLYQAQRNRRAAEGTLRAVAAKAGDRPDGIKAKALLAMSLLAGGDRDAARKLVDDVLAKDQRNEQGLLLKAGMAIDEGKLDQAIADLRVILRDAPDSARALLLLAKAHELAGSPDLAADHYLRAFQASDLAPAYGMDYGLFLLRRGQSSRAEHVAEDVLRGTPDFLPARRLLAQARINQGNWVGAEAVAQDIRKRGDGGGVSDQIMGEVFAGRKDYAESIAAFKRAFEATPSEARPAVALVRAYLRAGKTAEAIRFLDSMLQANPDNVNARLLLGQLHAMRNDQAAATHAFAQVIGLAPEMVIGYLSLANLHMRAGRIEEADKVIDQGLAVLPGDFSLGMTRAGAHEVAGRFEEAIRLYEDLIRRRPNADVLANNLASLLSDHRTDKASLERAHELAQRFRGSDVPHFKDTLGWTYYRLGKLDEALSLIREVVKESPDLPVFRYHLGMVYLAMNDRERARQELEKGLALAQGRRLTEVEPIRQALQGM